MSIRLRGELFILLSCTRKCPGTKGEKKQIETVITHQVIWRTMPWTFFAVQLLDSVARQQPEPRSSLDINRGVLLLCPNSISLASFLHFTWSTMGPPNLACGEPPANLQVCV